MQISMTQEELVQLGFQKISYDRETLDKEGFFEDKEYYFYSYTLDEVTIENRYKEEVDKEGIELVSNGSRAFDLPRENGDGWYVEFSDYANIRFYDKQDIKALIDIFNKNKKESD